MNDPLGNGESAIASPGLPPAIPDMKLLRQIGKGGFGEVWLARNQTTGGLRAVKIVPLRGTGAVDPAGREIVSLSCLEQTARVRDPNLVTIHHVGRTADYLFYIMDTADDVSGGSVSPGAEYTPATLAVRLRCGSVTGDDCVRWSKQLLSALACLHRQGLVHRDVKPSNCLSIDGQLKLADFGLLAQVDRSVSRVGTLEYMPPDGIMDTRADVYAAGLVIYQMITGLPAHRFPAIETRARMILADPRLMALNRLVLKACQSDRNARFADAVAMLQTFQEEVVDRTPSDRVEGMKVAPSRIPRLLGRAIVVGCLAVALVGGWLVWRGLSPVPRVDVNFITDQWDAEIWLDGRRLCQPDGEPWLTPCTVAGVSAETHVVVLKRQGLQDLVLGQIDFGKTREVSAHWETADSVDSGTTCK